jgi:hypothetical protein
MEQIIKKLSSPANRIGTFLAAHNSETGPDRRGRRRLLLQLRSACGAPRASSRHARSRQ